ncbi:hypothetical protein [Aquabacterium humicola]|uniref:hypothetical protein n=1 Tax=Aquabacterium humicola TaxID=3237377 RepID=UPI002542F806|nr:hypothetical protein [Rubrivivax pictus]
MEIRFTDAHGFDRGSDGADMAAVLFTRTEVEAGLVGSAVERLMLFSDDARQVRRFAGRVILVFSGYDQDPRPLARIPECVRFFRRLDEHWSYWLHFLVPDPEVIRLALLLRLDVDVRMQRGLQVGYGLRRPSQLAEVLHRWFGAMNALHDMHGIGDAFNESRSRAVMAALEGWM